MNRLNIQTQQEDGFFPIVEIELEGNIFFKQLNDAIHYQYKTPYNILKADIEFQGKANFGKLLIHLRGTQEGNEQVISFFNQSKIKNRVLGYAA